MIRYTGVKILNELAVTLLCFITFQGFLYLVVKIDNVNIFILVLNLAVVFLMDYLISKGIKNKISFLISVLLAALIMYGYYQNLFMLYNLVIIIVSMSMINNSSEKFSEYTFYGGRIIKYIIILFVILFYVVCRYESGGAVGFLVNIMKLSIVLIILCVLLLRKARGILYEVETDKSKKINMLIVATAFLLSFNAVTNFLMKILKIIFSGISFVFSPILKFIFKYVIGFFIYYILFPIGEVIMKGLLKLFRLFSFNIKIGTIKKVKKTNPDEIDVIFSMPNNIQYILFFIILLVVLYLVYIKLKKTNISNTIDKQDFIEEREKIKKEGASQNKNLSIFNKLKNMFGLNNNRDKILAVYKSFEKDTDKKGIYKKYMTAAKLCSITSMYIDSKEELKNFTNEYNEAKFSEHPIENEKVKIFKEEYSRIKKEI